MRVLGIDSSLTGTGLCRAQFSPWLPGTELQLRDPPVAELEAIIARFGAPNPGTDRTYRAMSRRVTALLDKIETAFDDLDLVCMESLAFGAKGASAYVLPWLWGDIIHLCEKYEVPLIVAGTSQVKKYATGNGNAGKDEVMLSVARRFPAFQVDNNDQADAVICCAIGCRYLGHPIDKMPQIHWMETMKKLNDGTPKPKNPRKKVGA